MTGRTFEKRFLSDCRITHGAARLSGSVPALLDGRHGPLAASPLELLANTGGTSISLSTIWLLVIRAAVWRQWQRHDPPQLRNAHVLMVEDLLPSIGGRQVFDQLVEDLVGSGFADAWF
jgi:hypothetical protein